MRTILVWIIFGAACLASAEEPAGEQRPQRSQMTVPECEVWRRETDFARSVEAHDSAAFANFIHPDAVFISGNTVLSGRDSIVKAWQALVEGKGQIALRWRPAQVAVSKADPSLAISTGPVWLKDSRSAALVKFRLGTFVSTWKQSDTGVWQVLYDAGSNPAPVSHEEFETVQTGSPPSCA